MTVQRWHASSTLRLLFSLSVSKLVYLITVVPNVMGICIYSPPLDKVRNSVRGVQFCEKLVKAYQFHRFGQSQQQRTTPTLNIILRSDSLLQYLLIATSPYHEHHMIRFLTTKNRTCCTGLTEMQTWQKRWIQPWRKPFQWMSWEFNYFSLQPTVTSWQSEGVSLASEKIYDYKHYPSGFYFKGRFWEMLIWTWATMTGGQLCTCVQPKVTWIASSFCWRFAKSIQTRKTGAEIYHAKILFRG